MTKKSNNVTPSSRWAKAGTHSDFVTADSERNVLLNDETMQAKVRYRHAAGVYTVHYRKNPALVEDKSTKKKNKKEKRANKKRSQKDG